MATPSLFPPLAPELCVEILEHMDIDMLVRLRRTSRRADVYVTDALRRRFRRLFGHAISQWDRFLELLESTQSVISGVAALAAMFPHHPAVPVAVDIYIPHGRLNRLHHHLVSVEEFGQAVPWTGFADEDADLAHLSGVVTSVDIRKGAILVRLIESDHTSALYPLVSQWNSALINYISPVSFVSAYPKLTSRNRALFTPMALDPDGSVPQELEVALKTWSQARWSLRHRWGDWAPHGHCAGPSSSGCASATRHLGDACCTIASWRLRGPLTVPPSPDTDETCYWWRGGSTCAPTCHSGQSLLKHGFRGSLRLLLRVD